MKKQKHGFTMIEMLVVIAIIGILAALLFPVLNNVQEKGRAVKCASNLRQLHTAAMSYMSNNGGHLPRSSSEEQWHREPDGKYTKTWLRGWVESYPNAANGKSFWWESGGSNGTFCIQNGDLFPYLGDKGDESVYVCPTMALKARKMFKDEKKKVVRSYGMNREVGYADYKGIDGVSRMVLFADQGFEKMTAAKQNLSNWNDGTTDGNPTTQEWYYKRYYRGIDGSIDSSREAAPKADTVELFGELHGRQPGAKGGMANAVFCDGHVERISYANTIYACKGDWEFGAPVK